MYPTSLTIGAFESCCFERKSLSRTSCFCVSLKRHPEQALCNTHVYKIRKKNYLYIDKRSNEYSIIWTEENKKNNKENAPVYCTHFIFNIRDKSNAQTFTFFFIIYHRFCTYIPNIYFNSAKLFSFATFVEKRRRRRL